MRVHAKRDFYFIIYKFPIFPVHFPTIFLYKPFLGNHEYNKNRPNRSSRFQVVRVLSLKSYIYVTIDFYLYWIYERLLIADDYWNNQQDDIFEHLKFV